MDGVDGGRRRRSLKQRLGFKVMGCCGANWGFPPATVSVSGDGEVMNTRRLPEMDRSCMSPVSVSSPAPAGMNLAAALAAERRLRASPRGSEEGFDSVAGMIGNGTPVRASLMRLLKETNGVCGGDGGGNVGNDSVCCVCMGRNKGAAFIPCGHTYCRVCSRELWLNRGSCPLCNRPILEILDIF